MELDIKSQSQTVERFLSLQHRRRNMEFNFKLDEKDGQIILNALVKEPYGLVADVIAKIQDQASKQKQMPSSDN